MKDYLKKLQQKYNYDKTLITYLNKIIPSLITYYGTENQKQILDAIDDCEIHFQKENENDQEYLKNYITNYHKWKKPIGVKGLYKEEFITQDGKVILRKPIIYIYTQNTGKYIPFDLTIDSNLAVLVHELCHLVKGYKKIQIIDNKIRKSTGLMYQEYDLEGNPLNDEEYDINCGIEEAINCYDEQEIMKIILEKEYKNTAYNNVAEIASKLMDCSVINSAIRQSQFHKTDKWIEVIGKKESDSLIKNFDTIIKINYITNNDVPFDDEAEVNKLIEAGITNPDEIYKIIMEKIVQLHDQLWAPVLDAQNNIDAFIENYKNTHKINNSK